jgi:hypothetical protein
MMGSFTGNRGQKMARSFRVFYPNQPPGVEAKNFNINGFEITNGHAVLVTAALFPGGPGTFGPDLNTRLQVHGPLVWVSNIVPHGSASEATGVEFVLPVDNTSQPANVAATITVFDRCEGFG